MNRWKKEALEKLQEIESQSSVYTHQKIILDNERPSIFYTIPEKRLSIDDAISLVRANLPLQLPSGEFSQTVTKQVLKLLEKSKEKITTVASLFVAIESNWGVVDEKFTRTKFYDHYHPPRGNSDEISTLSYFSPIHIENAVTEKFYYCDLSKLNLEGKPYRYWRENNPLDIAKNFQELSAQTKPHDWKNLEFPKEGALEVAFDSFFNLHNLSGLSGNMFLTIVINDVEMKTKLQKGELNFTYLNSSEI